MKLFFKNILFLLLIGSISQNAFAQDEVNDVSGASNNGISGDPTTILTNLIFNPSITNAKNDPNMIGMPTGGMTTTVVQEDALSRPLFTITTDQNGEIVAAVKFQYAENGDAQIAVASEKILHNLTFAEAIKDGREAQFNWEEFKPFNKDIATYDPRLVPINPGPNTPKYPDGWELTYKINPSGEVHAISTYRMVSRTRTVVQAATFNQDGKLILSEIIEKKKDFDATRKSNTYSPKTGETIGSIETDGRYKGRNSDDVSNETWMTESNYSLSISDPFNAHLKKGPRVKSATPNGIISVVPTTKDVSIVLNFNFSHEKGSKNFAVDSKDHPLLTRTAPLPQSVDFSKEVILELGNGFFMHLEYDPVKDQIKTDDIFFTYSFSKDVDGKIIIGDIPQGEKITETTTIKYNKKGIRVLVSTDENINKENGHTITDRYFSDKGLPTKTIKMEIIPNLGTTTILMTPNGKERAVLLNTGDKTVNSLQVKDFSTGKELYSVELQGSNNGNSPYSVNISGKGVKSIPSPKFESPYDIESVMSVFDGKVQEIQNTAKDKSKTFSERDKYLVAATFKLSINDYKGAADDFVTAWRHSDNQDDYKTNLALYGAGETFLHITGPNRLSTAKSYLRIAYMKLNSLHNSNIAKENPDAAAANDALWAMDAYLLGTIEAELGNYKMANKYQQEAQELGYYGDNWSDEDIKKIPKILKNTGTTQLSPEDINKLLYEGGLHSFLKSDLSKTENAMGLVHDLMISLAANSNIPEKLYRFQEIVAADNTRFERVNMSDWNDGKSTEVLDKLEAVKSSRQGSVEDFVYTAFSSDSYRKVFETLLKDANNEDNTPQQKSDKLYKLIGYSFVLTYFATERPYLIKKASSSSEGVSNIAHEIARLGGIAYVESCKYAATDEGKSVKFDVDDKMNKAKEIDYRGIKDAVRAGGF